MDILVAYDVKTESKEGRRRLRKVAAACKDFGQRVQYSSVFERSVTHAQMEALRERLLGILGEEEDNLRIYRLRAPREEFVECYGKDGCVSFDAPLIHRREGRADPKRRPRHRDLRATANILQSPPFYGVQRSPRRARKGAAAHVRANRPHTAPPKRHYNVAVAPGLSAGRGLERGEHERDAHRHQRVAPGLSAGWG